MNKFRVVLSAAVLATAACVFAIAQTPSIAPRTSAAALPNGKIWVGQINNSALAVTPSGDCHLSNTYGAIVCTSLRNISDALLGEASNAGSGRRFYRILSTQTADRFLNFGIGDNDYTLTLNGTAATLSGTNTGDQTITLTGNVTGSGTGSFATTIASGVVTGGMLATSAVDLAGTKITGILGAANGGNGNGFFAVSGPASSTKTFTFPNANATVLTTNAAVTVAQGGTGLATLTNHALMLGAGTSNVGFTGLGTTTTVLHGNASADPTYGAVVLTTDVSGVLPSANGGAGTLTGILKANGSGTTSAAVGNTDYLISTDPIVTDRYIGQFAGNSLIWQMTATTTGTGYLYGTWTNTTGQLLIGVESSTGTSVTTGNTGYSSFVGSGTATNFCVATNNACRFIFDSAGANVATNVPFKLKSYVVGSLPSASTSGAGAMAYTTDANTTCVLGLGNTAVGGGSNKCVVVSDGINWILQ